MMFFPQVISAEWLGNLGSEGYFAEGKELEIHPGAKALRKQINSQSPVDEDSRLHQRQEDRLNSGRIFHGDTIERLRTLYLVIT